MPPEIPQELRDSFIDHLALEEDCHSSLQACALVSPSFRTRSQQHLFRHVKLSYDYEQQGPKYSQKLHDVLRANPSLRSCVRVLEISFDESHRESLPPLVPKIIDLLHGEPCGYNGIHTLKLTAKKKRWSRQSNLNLDLWTLEYYKSLFHLFADDKTSLRALHVSGNFPIEIILQGRYLRELRLSGSLFRCQDSNDAVWIQLRPYIESFNFSPRPMLRSVHTKDKSLWNFVQGHPSQPQGLDMSALEEFTIWWPEHKDQGSNILSLLLGPSESTLQSLTLYFVGNSCSEEADSDSRMISEQTILSRFKDLRYLDCEAVDSFWTGVPMRSLSSLFRLFSPPTGDVVTLRRIKITLLIDVGHYQEEDILDPTHGLNFQQLDMDLSSANFPNLRAVHIRVSIDFGIGYYDYNNQDEGAEHDFNLRLEALLRNSFPRLRASPSIDFTITKESYDHLSFFAMGET